MMVWLLLHSYTDWKVGPKHSEMKEKYRMRNWIFYGKRKIKPNRVSYETRTSEMNYVYSRWWCAWVDRNGCGVYSEWIKTDFSEKAVTCSSTSQMVFRRTPNPNLTQPVREVKIRVQQEASIWVLTLQFKYYCYRRHIIFILILQWFIRSDISEWLQY
jgi:hypothetical protein